MLKEVNAEIKLVDHHITSKDIPENHEWYNVQHENSATKEFFDILCEQNPDFKPSKELSSFVNNVDNYDLYKEPLSDDWLKGTLFQELSFDISRMFNSGSFISKLQKGQLDKQETSNFIRLDEIKIKAIISIFKKVMTLLSHGRSVVEIINYDLPEIFEDELEKIIFSCKDENKRTELDKIVRNDTLNIKEKIILVNNIVYGFENRQIPYILNNDNDISVELSMKLNKTFPYKSLPELNKQIKSKIIPNLSFEKHGNKELIEREFNIQLDSFLREVISKDDRFNQSYFSNHNIPLDILSPLSFGVVGLDNLGHIDFKNEHLNSIIKVCFDVDGGYFQHASHSYNDDNDNYILINLSFLRGKASARSVNGKAVEVCSIFGGGGHPDAGGFSIDYSKFLSTEELDFINNKEKCKKTREEIKNKISSYLKDTLVSQLHHKIENNTGMKI